MVGPNSDGPPTGTAHLLCRSCIVTCGILPHQVKSVHDPNCQTPQAGFVEAYVTWATAPGFKRSRTVTTRWESMVTASTRTRAAPTTRRLTALTASTLFLTATWYRLVPEWSVTSTIQPKACLLMNAA